jgi:malonyl CoA-acyl carrier protein transacylase
LSNFKTSLNAMNASFAFVFPGQGSQSVGMLTAWGDHPAVRSTLEEASTALGEDVGRLIAEGPKEALDLTTNTQPVMLTAASPATAPGWPKAARRRLAVAGHSLGEYSALVAAGALSLADALPLVRLRAQAMQEAVPVGVGGMAAILGLDAAVRAKAAAGRGGQRRGGRGGQLQRPEADRDRRQQGRRREGLRSAEGRWAPSARCRCRCRRRSTAA